MSKHVFDWTQAFRSVDGKEVSGKRVRSRRKVYPEARTLVLESSMSGYSTKILNDQGVLKSDPEYLYKSVSFPTLLTTLLTSEGQWPRLGHREFSAEPCMEHKLSLLFS